jgi:putative ABC transport system permease protein
MISLIWAMMRARLGRAAITFVLAALAAAAAAAGPLYQSAAAVSLRTVEVGSLPASEQVLTTALLADDATVSWSNPPAVKLPAGARMVLGGMAPGAIAGPAAVQPVTAVWRSGVCEHLVFTSGRCMTADREIVLAADAARVIGVVPGDDVTFSIRSDFDSEGVASPAPLTVVGLYAPLDSDDLYWAGRTDLFGSDRTAAFATARTLTAISPQRMVTLDVLMTPDTFADLDAFKDSLQTMSGNLGSGGYYVNSGDLREFAVRLAAREQQLANSLLPSVAPLVLLCWLVLFIAVGGAIEGRRGELGLTALRGVPSRARLFLATVETAAPVLVALVPGYLLGLAVTSLIALWVLPGSPPVDVNPLSFVFAGAAVLGALIACLLAQVSDLSAPVIGLLRKAQQRRRGRVAAGVEIAVGTIALVAGYQAIAIGTASGVALLAPLCVSLGLGLVAARAIAIPAERVGRMGLGRGRLRTGLAALSLARGAGTHWIVVLLVVSFGLLGFAVSASNVAHRAWQDQSTVEVGATRVLSVEAVSAHVLLNAVRSADPEGQSAMAVVEVQSQDDRGVLAVDSARLPAVALWPASYGSTSAADVARVLRTQPVSHTMVQASELRVTLTLDAALADTEPSLTLQLGRPTGNSPALVEITPLLPGTNTYSVPTPDCADAPCELQQVVVDFERSSTYLLDLTVGDITDGDDTMLVSAAQLGALDWRQPVPTSSSPSADLRLDAQGINLRYDSVLPPTITLFADSAPVPLPVVAGGDAPSAIALAPGSESLAVTTVGHLAQAPRFGPSGILVDLEYLGMRADNDLNTSRAEVWLAPDAPADIVQKLIAGGLVVTGDRTFEATHHRYEQGGPALAMWFLVFAAFCGAGFAAAGLLVMAVLERGRDDRGLAVLRAQGLPESAVRAAALWSRFVLVVAGCVVGLVAAAVSWAFARGVVPILDGETAVVRVPQLPDLLSVVVPVGIVLVALLATCVVAARIAVSQSEGETS